MDNMLYKSIISIIKCYNRLVESFAGEIPVRECEVNRELYLLMHFHFANNTFKK